MSDTHVPFHGWKPVPDPTELTTQLIDRALASLRDVVETRLTHLDHEQTRGIADRRTNMEDGRRELREAVARQDELRAQGIATQRDSVMLQNASNAAAVTKSEAAVVKQIDGIVALLAGGSKATDDKIAAITARLDRGEGTDHGSSSTLMTIIAVAGVVAAITGATVALVAHVSTPTPVASFSK